MDIYHRSAATADGAIERAKISNTNKRIIKNYNKACTTERLTVGRIIKCSWVLVRFATALNKDFTKASKKDIEKLIAQLEENEKLSVWTKYDYKAILKKFYRWLRKTEDYPPEVKWIKLSVKDSEKKLPEEMLTEEDIEKLIESAEHPRDKALISTLYESGCRIGELLSLKIKNVQFDKYGTVILVNGKTGPRRIRLIASTAYLSAWLNIHPKRSNIEEPLWVGIGTTNKGKFVDYSGINKMLRETVKKAGINKKVNPHNFRHSRATYLANRLTEAQMKEYFGWTQGSDMAATYIHLSGRDIDDAILGVYGLKEREEQESKLKPKKCSRCFKENPSTARFCTQCAAPLDLETAMEIETKREDADEFMTKIVSDPEIGKVIAKKIIQLGLKKELRKIIEK